MVGAPAAQAGKFVDRVVGSEAPGTAGGSLYLPQEVAVNRTGAGGVPAGTLYVADYINHRVQRFSPAGAFERTWGADVDLPAGGDDLEVCTVAANCKAGARSAGNGTAAGNGTFSGPVGVAVDGDTGNVYVASQDSNRVDVFDADGAFLRAFGFDVVASGPGNTGTGYEVCVQADGDVCQTGTGGDGTGQFAPFAALGNYHLAVTPPDGNAATGKLYMANTSNHRVEAYDLDGTDPSNFGSGTLVSPSDLTIDDNGIVYVSSRVDQNPVERYDVDSASFLAPIDVASLASDVNSSQDTNGLDIDPDSGNLLVARDSTAAGIIEIGTPATTPTFVDRHVSTGTLRGVTAGPVAGEIITFFSSDFDQRILILNDGPTPALVTLGGSTAIGSTAATLNATVDSSGTLPTDYRLEASRNGIDWDTAASGTVAAGVSEAIATPVTGLRPNTLYRVRMIASRTLGNPEVVSAETTFLTDAISPEIVSSGSDSVTDTSARLTGYVNPHSTATSYRFEWGTESGSYPNRLPMPNASLGAGPDPVLATQQVDGLDPATIYYFRLVAISSTEGTVAGPERALTTRAAPVAGRVAELVSPPVKSTSGHVGVYTFSEMEFQSSVDGDSVLYPVAYGLPDSTSMGTMRYKAVRGPDGWASTQLTPTATVTSHPDGSEEWGGRYQFVSPDLSCGVVGSAQPLTSDAPTEPRDYNGTNLFRRDQDGEYSLLTPVVPSNVSEPAVATTNVSDPAGGYRVYGSSPDCDRVVFKTIYRYPGLNDSGFYESEGGTLRDIGVLPDGSTPTGPAMPGAGDIVLVGSGHDLNQGTEWRAVSRDASRVFFTAKSNDGGDSGKSALYLREGGVTVKVSGSETATVNQGAFYQAAAVDGSKVAFMANYGLTADSSSGPVASNCRGVPPQPCALYVYDVDSGELTDISADSNPADTNGATVAGVVDASEDMSRIYFAASGQLVAGEGSTYSQNVEAQTSNLYLWDEGALSFVATVRSADLAGGQDQVTALDGAAILARTGNFRTSQVTPDGRFLLFSSTANIVGYDSGGAIEAYLYSADSGETVCVSCRRDGEPSVDDEPRQVLNNPGFSYPLGRPRNISVDGKRVFFSSRDALAEGAVNGNSNVYVWDQGVVRLLATGTSTVSSSLINIGPVLYGASASGDDVFIRTTEALDPSDTDGVNDLYDFRVGGGFPVTPPGQEECSPLTGSCQGGGAGAEQGDTPSSAFDGPGNAAPGREPAKGSCATAKRQVRRVVSQTRVLQRVLSGLRRQNAGAGKRARLVKVKLRSSKKSAARAKRRLASCNGGGK